MKHGGVALKNTHPNLTKGYIPYFLIFLLIALVYFNTISFSFSPMDDHWLFVKRMPMFSQLSSLTVFFSEALLGKYYRPLWTSSFMLDTLIGGGQSWAFHLMNIIYHFIASVLIYVFLKKISIPSGTAIFLTCIFSVHPINVQAVAWIPGRNDTLLAVFALGAIICYHNFIVTKQYFWFLSQLGALAAALFIKENAIVIPFVLLAYHFIFFEKYSKSSLWRLCVIWLLVLIAWLLLRNNIVSVYLNILHSNLWTSIVDLGLAFIMDLGKIILLVNQSVMPTVIDTNLIPFFVVDIVFLIACIKLGFMNKKLALFGFVWFIFFIIIPMVSGSFDNNWEHYEHRLYIPSIGILIIVSQLNFSKLGIFKKEKNILILKVLMLFFFSLKTFAREKVFKTPLSLAEAGVKESPHKAYFYELLGELSAERGNYEKALLCFDKYISINSQKGIVYYQRGAVYGMLNDDRKALENFQTALQIEPNRILYLQSCANAYLKLGQLENAKKMNEQIRKGGGEVDPEMERQLLSKSYINPEVLNSQGIDFFKSGNFAQAIVNFSAAINLNPIDYGYLANRAAAFEMLNKYDSTYFDFVKAKKLGYQIEESALNELKQKIKGINLEGRK